MTFDSQKAGRDGAPKASDRAAIEPQRLEAPDPIELARADARMFGCGLYRIHPNGHIEYIPADQVTICTRPNTQED